jgi:hypothetical protein
MERTYIPKICISDFLYLIYLDAHLLQKTFVVVMRHTAVTRCFALFSLNIRSMGKKRI